MASLPVYLKPLCGNASFISRSDQAALARKVTTEERRSVATEIHFPSAVRSTSFSHFQRDLSLSLSVTSRLLYAPRSFHLVLRRPEAESSSTSRGRQVCRRHYSLSSPTVVLLCRVFFHNDLSSHYPSPSVFHFYFYYYNLLPLLLLRRSLLLISLVSTSQGPFSRRSLLLTEHALHAAFVSVNRLYIEHYELP